MAHSFSTVLAVVKTHCTTVGNAVTPKIAIVRACDVESEARQITIEYAGTTDNPFASHTLSATQYGKRIEIKVWLPVRSLEKTPLETVEAQIEDIDARLRAAIMGDVTLGNPSVCMGVMIEDSATAKEQMMRKDSSAVFFRTLTVPVVIGLSDVDTIAS